MASTKKLPSPLVAAGQRYVYFKTLYSEKWPEYQELGRDATKVIIDTTSKLIRNSGKQDRGDAVKEALDFLQNAAAYERQKELKFFQNFNSQYPEAANLFNINPQQILDNYPQFIININRAIKGADLFDRQLRAEKARIEKNNNIAKKYYELNKKDQAEQEKQYNADLHANENQLFSSKDSTSLFNAIFSHRSEVLSELTDMIINQYGTDLFTWHNTTGLSLNSRQLDTLLMVLIARANEIYITKYKNTTSNIKFTDKIAQDRDFINFVKVLLESDNLTSIIDSIADQYHLKKDTSEKLQKNNNAIKRLQERLRIQYNKLYPTQSAQNQMPFKKWLAQNNITEDRLYEMWESIQGISAQAYYIGEDRSALDLVAAKIMSILGGGANPTDDIEAGKLIVNFKFDVSKMTQLEQQLWASQEKHFKKIKATSDLNSFRENTEELLAARKEQQELIKTALEESGKGKLQAKEILSHMVIHSTVKGYQSAGSYTFKKRGGFGGAAFGANLNEELLILNDVAESGGFTQFDMNHLFISMINAGKGMIGEDFKHDIENYFSIFVGLLMFNDASIMANDVQKWVNSNKLDQVASVEDLHLYQLNGVIVPSSYILEETHRALSELTQIDESYRGIQVSLTTYNGGPINHDWEQTSAMAIKNTKLEKIHFLAGFYDLLDDIEKQLGQIN